MSPLFVGPKVIADFCSVMDITSLTCCPWAELIGPHSLRNNEHYSPEQDSFPRKDFFSFNERLMNISGDGFEYFVKKEEHLASRSVPIVINIRIDYSRIRFDLHWIKYSSIYCAQIVLMVRNNIYKAGFGVIHL